MTRDPLPPLSERTSAAFRARAAADAFGRAEEAAQAAADLAAGPGRGVPALEAEWARLIEIAQGAAEARREALSIAERIEALPT